MFRIRLLPSLLFGSVVLLVWTEQTPAQATAQTPNQSRESMWFAPGAEDWNRPVQITFQRTWEDAIAVSKETGKAILICVNMDGEIASEHYAGIRYRQPEIAKLYEPYVTVIASVYRHNPRDFDVNGNRILCPRFGSVTCGEHIWIEPILFEKYFEGVRVAPRHVMVELDGSESYDVYYANDTDSVFLTIQEGISNRDAPPPIVRGDRTLVERVASRDVADREAVEKAYKAGDQDLRGTLLKAAMQHDDAAPDDLLRLAVYGFDPELARLAREALSKTDSIGAIELINEALRVPLEDSEREKMIAALARLGEKSERAHTLARVHKGLGTNSDQIEEQAWSTDNRGASYAAPGIDAVTNRLETADMQRPDDAQAKLAKAVATLELAADPRALQTENGKVAGRYARLRLEDAYRTALEAEALGATGWRMDAVIGLCSYYLGDLDTAYPRVEAAVAKIPSGNLEWSAIATIALFAQQRQQAITIALNKKEDWPGKWLTDVNAAYAVLAHHPLGRDEHVASHFRFLMRLGAFGRAERVLDEGLQRFPDSWVLHGHLRGRILWRDGVEGLEAAYESMLEGEDAPPNLRWFAGYASIVAAENHRRQGKPGAAIAAYDRALAHYSRGIEHNPVTRNSADHYASIALAGRARISLESNDLEDALDQILASFERKPEAAASRDGLNLSAVGTARMLRARLGQQGTPGMVERLDHALTQLDPALLELPAFERTVPGANPTNWSQPPSKGPGGDRK
ncbi:MAG: hypothetical protein CMJ89_16460 [Planctomycetes bacterium]|nr:hypothetical protein [Planctomycetota bacterium]